MIDARFVRLLDVASPPGEVAVSHLSAASGIARVGQQLFVVADDELTLCVFDITGTAPGQLVRLFDGQLPLPHRQRKASKPDIEALAALPAFEGYPCGALFCVGSGSKPNRQRAVLLRLDPHGAVAGAPVHIDMAPIYAPLRTLLPDLNIEGVFVAAGDLCLLQRGNRKSQINACIRFDWQPFERWLLGAGPAPGASSTTTFELGSIAGVPLSFTDGTALEAGAWAFCAAAEDTSDSSTDGRCAGSAVGIVSADGTLLRLEHTTAAFKAEGITLAAQGDPLQLLLVTDADDRRVAAQLVSVSLARTA